MRRTIGLAVPVVLILLILMRTLNPAYADGVSVVTITPNPAGANQTITFSNPGLHSATVTIYSGSGCTGTVVDALSVPEDTPYMVFLNAGLPAGSYSATDNGVPNCVSFTVLPTSDTVATATGLGTASFTTTAGGFSSLAASAVGSISPPPPSGLSFPDGLFSFTIRGLSNGQTVTVTITLPAALPPGNFAYYKFQGGAWTQFPSATLDSTRTVITLTLTADGTGTITDPGGPTTQTAIPEYPYGLTLLATLLPFAYVVLRRRAVNKSS